MTEPTVFVCLALAVAGTLLALDGTGANHNPRAVCICVCGSRAVCPVCLMHVEQACVLDRASNLVIVIIGYVTLVPVLLCLLAAWKDRDIVRTVDGYSRLQCVPTCFYNYDAVFITACCVVVMVQTRNLKRQCKPSHSVSACIFTPAIFSPLG